MYRACSGGKSTSVRTDKSPKSFELCSLPVPLFLLQIQFIYLFNGQGKCCLEIWYQQVALTKKGQKKKDKKEEPSELDKRKALTRILVSTILHRYGREDVRYCNILEHDGRKFVYQRYVCVHPVIRACVFIIYEPILYNVFHTFF